jgi:hypothetical protein
MLYPNPNTGAFWLQLPSKQEVKFYNLEGKELSAMFLEAGKHHIEIDLQPGVYIAVFTESNQKTHTQRIVVH